MMWGQRDIRSVLADLWKGGIIAATGVLAEYTVRAQEGNVTQHFAWHVTSTGKPTWMSLWSILEMLEFHTPVSLFSQLYGGNRWLFIFTLYFLFLLWRFIARYRTDAPQSRTVEFTLLCNYCFSISLALIVLNPNAVPQFTIWVFPFVIFTSYLRRYIAYFMGLTAVAWLNQFELFQSYVFDLVQLTDGSDPTLLPYISVPLLVVNATRLIFTVLLMVLFLKPLFIYARSAATFNAFGITLGYETPSGSSGTLRLDASTIKSWATSLSRHLNYTAIVSAGDGQRFSISLRHFVDAKNWATVISVSLFITIIGYPIIKLCLVSVPLLWNLRDSQNFPVLPSQRRFESTTLQMDDCRYEFDQSTNVKMCNITLTQIVAEAGWDISAIRVSIGSKPSVTLHQIQQGEVSEDFSFDISTRLLSVYNITCTSDLTILRATPNVCQLKIAVDSRTFTPNTPTP